MSSKFDLDYRVTSPSNHSRINFISGLNFSKQNKFVFRVDCFLLINDLASFTFASVFVVMLFVDCIPAFAKFPEFRKTRKRRKREVDTEHRSPKKLSEKFRQLINKIGETSQEKTLFTRARDIKAYQFSLCSAFCKYYANLFFHKKRAQEKGEQKTRRDLETH